MARKRTEEQKAKDRNCKAKWSLKNRGKERIRAATYRQRLGPDVLRERRLWNKYKITSFQYNELLEKQGGKCAICPNRDGHKKLGLVVDHDHQTGNIRGLLCDKCNTSLGNFHDDVSLIRSAAKYLEETTKSPALVVSHEPLLQDSKVVWICECSSPVCSPPDLLVPTDVGDETTAAETLH